MSCAPNGPTAAEAARCRRASQADEDTNLWTVGTDTGETVTATYLITGVGLLSAPNLPPIKGLDTFQGELVHTARWPGAGVDFAGKRVGLVGTGSTGIQILPELLTPRGYPYGAKRPPAGTGYYETFNRDNVTLIDVSDDAIEEITPTGLRTGTRRFDLDVIIFATGFDASTGSFTRIDIRGRGGRALADKWRDGPVTNLGFSTAGFPNLFMITGPLSPFANIPTCIEETVDWIFDAISYLRENGLTSFEAAESGERQWAEHVTAVANMISAGKGEAVNIWFAGANIEGKPRAINVYFGGANAYFDACRAAAAKSYERFVLS